MRVCASSEATVLSVCRFYCLMHLLRRRKETRTSSVPHHAEVMQRVSAVQIQRVCRHGGLRCSISIAWARQLGGSMPGTSAWRAPMRTSGARASGYIHKNYSPAMPVQIPCSNRQVENVGGFRDADPRRRRHLADVDGGESRLKLWVRMRWPRRGAAWTTPSVNLVGKVSTRTHSVLPPRIALARGFSTNASGHGAVACCWKTGGMGGGGARCWEMKVAERRRWTPLLFSAVTRPGRTACSAGAPRRRSFRQCAWPARCPARDSLCSWCCCFSARA